ncbi:MAG: hypothetical protein AB7S26_23215 [Sandaracinaceae bacterium]
MQTTLAPAVLAIATLALSVFAGCASGPTCSDSRDATGRPITLCGARQVAVCDLEGDEARFEDDGTGYQLVGGVNARCSFEFQIECGPGGVGEAYCITDPEL